MGGRPPARADRSRRRTIDRLPGRWRDLPEVGTWPFRQTVPVPTLAPEALGAAVEAAFREVGYAFDPDRPLAEGATGYRPRGGPLLLAEREIRPAPLSRPKRTAAIVLAVSGLILGSVEAIVFGDPFLAVPWIIGAIGAGLLFALVLNRAYDSDVVVVVPLIGPRPGAPDPGSPPVRTRSTVVFLGAQVRSEVFGRAASGSREAVSITDEVHALSGMTEVAKAFERAIQPRPSAVVASPAPGPRPGPIG